MHTGAELAVSDDGKSAILTSSSGKQIKATIINGSDYTFEIMAAEFDTTYGSDIKPLVETSNGTGCTGSASKTCDASGHYHKLAVRTPVGENITRFRLAVAIEPYVEGDTSVAEYAPIETWKKN